MDLEVRCKKNAWTLAQEFPYTFIPRNFRGIKVSGIRIDKKGKLDFANRDVNS